MAQAFRAGIPYALDVKRLKEAFPIPSLNEGREIKHAELEAVIELPKGTGRYYGIIDSWRHQMKNVNGIFIIWEPGKGVKVLAPAEILDHAETKTRQKIGQTVRATAIFPWVDRNRLNPMGQKRFDHDMRVALALKDALHAGKKQMATDLAPIQSLPKPKLIQQA